jgi:CHAD domain-containing protein
MDKQQIRSALREIEAERKTLDKREKALNALLLTFEEPEKPRVRRTTGKVRDREVLDLIRSNPNKEWNNREVADCTGMPYTSAGSSMIRLAEAHQVTVIGDWETEPGSRVAPVIKHKPVRIVPGKSRKAA